MSIYIRLKGQGIFSLDVNKYLRLQVTLNSRYPKIVIRYSFYRVFAERQESHVSRNEITVRRYVTVDVFRIARGQTV